MRRRPDPRSETSVCIFSWTPSTCRPRRPARHLLSRRRHPGADRLPAQALRPASNHFQSPFSSPLPLTIKGDVVFKSVTCVNQIVGSINPKVEVGHPLNCTVHLTKQDNTTPVSNQEVTWSTNNCLHTGVGTFTCGTDPSVSPGYDDAIIWAGTPPCWQPDISPSGVVGTACTTASNGKCAVLYRALFNSLGASSGTHVLNLSANRSTGQHHERRND